MHVQVRFELTLSQNLKTTVLKKRDDIVITKPEKGSGVVVMDKADYIRLLSSASVDNTSKFIHVDDKRPKSRGRPPKHYHPLLRKEKRELKEARNSFSFFQSNKHILSLDTVRVIILRRNLARVLSTHRRFLTLYFPPK